MSRKDARWVPWLAAKPQHPSEPHVHLDEDEPHMHLDEELRMDVMPKWNSSNRGYTATAIVSLVCRLVAGASIMELTCDLGILACTLVKLYSDTATATTASTAELRREIAFTFVSCALSILSFVASAMGIRKVYHMLANAVRRSSTILRSSLSVCNMGHVSSHGWRLPALQLPAT
eukprot:jgi/Ulvmu1/5800/UM025_0055.1